MINRKVIHKTFGEGVIIGFENNIATVRFSERDVDFRYPDVFARYLRFTDEALQSEAEEMAIESIKIKEEEKKKKERERAEELYRHYQHQLAEKTGKRKPSATQLKYEKEGNLAFKCNFCNGGCSSDCIGFKGVCSPETIRHNIEKEKRTWCSNEASGCGRYYRGLIDYGTLSQMHNDSFVCYESRMLIDWTAFAGENLDSTGVQRARRIMGAKQNGLAVLTTVFPNETDRVIFGVFITAETDEGDERSAGYVKADPQYTVELTPSEARGLKFWDYHENSNGSVGQWSSGLYRYLNNDECVRILKRIVEIKTGAEKTKAEKVLLRYAALKGISKEELA